MVRTLFFVVSAGLESFIKAMSLVFLNLSKFGFRRVFSIVKSCTGSLPESKYI